MMTSESNDAVVPRRSLWARVALYAVEVVLVMVILGLLFATWLPAIVGGNPP